MPLTSDSDGTGESLITPGKHLLLSVPDYDPSTAGNQTSFIRIGYPNVPWTAEVGADLVKLAYIVGPAGKEDDEDIKKRFASVKLADGTDNPEYDKSLVDLVAEYDAGFFPPFIDDQRERGTTGDNPAGSLGHGLAPADRKVISDALQSKCGWRDHSDGNRITTTRGDKIEVIQGNYKLIVMGRQPDPTQGMGWEASGNNVQDFAGATMPGASVTVTWIKEAYLDPVDVPALQANCDALTLEANTTIPARIAQIDHLLPTASTYHGGRGNTRSQKETLLAEKATLESRRIHILTVDIPAAQKAIKEGNEFNAGYQGGAWLLQNSTERVYQYSRNAGNFMNQEWGDLRETYTGSENPVRVGKHDDDGLQGHPSDHTVDPSPQAKEPFPRTSSVGLPRGNPRIIEKTWAEKIESYTGSEAWRIPSIHEETWVHDAFDTTHADSITSKTYADEMSETTHCTGTISSKTYAAATTELVAAAAIESHTTAAQITSVTETLNQIDLFLGATHVNVEITLGMLDIFLGFKKEFSFDQDYTALKKKETALKDLEISLSKQLAHMDTHWVSAKSMQTCLETTVKALKVSIG
jgi:hypothetical protein